MTWPPGFMRLLFFALSALFITDLALAQQRPSAVTEAFNLGQVPEISGRIAFTATVDGVDRIYFLDLDSKKVRSLIDGPGNNSYPAWSSDGKLLAFTSDRDGNKEIYLSNWDGDKHVRLTENKLDDDNPAWFPNSRRLVFYSEVAKERSDLYTIDLQNDTKPVRLTNLNSRNTTPKVSPDGRQIAYSTNRSWPGWDVCVWNLQSAADLCVLEGSQGFCRPDWSPDGNELAYSVGDGKDINIAVVNLKTKSMLQLTNMPLREYDVAWSPSGTHLVFAAEDGKSDQFKLYIVDRTTKRTSLLLSAPYSIRYLSWSGVTTLQLEAQRMIDKQKREEEERLRSLPQGNSAALQLEPRP